MKPSICKVCKSQYTKSRMGQVVCCPECAMTLARSKNAKAEKVEITRARRAAVANRKAAREKLKTRGDHIREAQTAFNAFIRERDRLAGHPCISSGRPLDWSGNAVDAGHYRSRGSAPHLRFDERNCHAQSKQENRYASGNVTGYRLGLIARIGQEAVDSLESDQVPRRYTVEQLIELKKFYKAKLKALKEAV